ncbi:MAG: YggT family protein [Spirochaetales bacterium]|jgi:YggT family protein|nr:YggT family protein [Spirochaetales bacterium]
MTIEIILRIISGALSVYMLLLFIRILLTWFSGEGSLGRPQEILKSVTDPYLNIFRRIPFLRSGRIDFSPIAAIISLGIVFNIVEKLRYSGNISLGFILALIVSALWSAAFFILGFFIILVAIRLVAVLIGRTSFNPFWQTIDLMVNPILSFIQRQILRGRQLSYKTGLGVGLGVLVLTAIVGRFLITQLTIILLRIPF